MSKWVIARRVFVLCFLVYLGAWLMLQRPLPHATLTTMQREWIALVLMFGIGVLYTVFGTKALIDWSRLRGLPSEAVSKAVPLWVGLIAALGLACTAFGAQALFFY